MIKTQELFKTSLSEKQKKNTELNLQECDQGKTTLESYPRRVVFELTNRCNFRCIMCGRVARKFQTFDMPMSTIEFFASQLPNVEEVTLHGWGEGTLHPEFKNILSYLNEVPHLRKYFVTNGSTLPKIKQHVFDLHVDVIAMSLDGATAATNDKIRCGGNFALQTSELKKLIDERQKRNENTPYINFVFTAMNSNIDELPDMIKLAQDLNVPEVKVVYLTIFERELLHESLFEQRDRVREIFQKTASLAQKANIKLKLPDIHGEGPAGQLRHKKCALPWRDLYIGSDGFIRPCQSSSLKLGNISEYNTFDSLWNSEQMKKLRESVNDETCMPKQCYHCYHSSYANWNLPHSFVQLEQDFAPDWGDKS